MMSQGLPPLPIPSPELAARSVKSPPWNALPTPDSGGHAADLPPAAALPPCPGDAPSTWPDSDPAWKPPSLANSPDSPPSRLGRSSGHNGTSAHSPPTNAFVPAQIVQSRSPEFTDADLLAAFGPMLEHANHNARYPMAHQLGTYLEPLLRATIRRALAESTPGARPFHAPGTMDRMIWHLQALFTSRTYEDIIFEKTNRFQVGEVFLVDTNTLGLVSYASCDPARHASPRRVASSVQRLARQLRDETGNLRHSFELPHQRHVIALTGRFVTLMAVVRGQPSELVIADLEFALRRIEERFNDQFQQQGSELLHTLQPFLEDCLLIQAPASAA